MAFDRAGPDALPEHLLRFTLLFIMGMRMIPHASIMALFKEALNMVPSPLNIPAVRGKSR